MSPTLFSTLALLFILYTQNVNASWRMNGKRLAMTRMDPLVNPGAVAPHVHNIVGGNNFAATYDYDKLRQSSCSTVEVQEDKSNYWAPSLYHRDKDTGKFKLVPSTGWAVYYLHRGPKNQTYVQFPKGFSMIAGSANKSRNTTTDDDAFDFHCLTGVSEKDPAESLELPKQFCPGGIRIQVKFPPCWDGINPTSANFKDHVSYPVGSAEHGPCPDSHPVRLMTIFLEQMADTSGFEYYPGAFFLSTGDNVGYSSHADFTNGWGAEPNSILEQAINHCTDPSANLDACKILKDNSSEDFNVCHSASKMPVENVGFYGDLDKIPGDNPPWGGNVPKKPTGVSNNPPWGWGNSTLPNGWAYHGCIDEGDSGTITLIADRFTDEKMNVALCVDYCDKKGYTLAGLEDRHDCGCDNSLTHGATRNLTEKWRCSAVCPGNQYENCGNSRKINLYEKTGATNLPSEFPAVGSPFTEVFTNNGSSSPFLLAASRMNTTSTGAPQPPNSTLGSNGSTTSTSAALPMITSSSTTPPNVPPPVDTTPTNTPPSVPPPVDTSSTTTPPGVPPAVDTSSTSTSPTNTPPSVPSAVDTSSTTTPPGVPPAVDASPTSTSLSATPTVNTPATTPPAANLPVCHTPKMVKRVPSFLKREPLESFHVPAGHRRRHH